MATARQRKLFARRILWLILGPDLCKKFKFPWCEEASQPLRREDLLFGPEKEPGEEPPGEEPPGEQPPGEQPPGEEPPGEEPPGEEPTQPPPGEEPPGEEPTQPPETEPPVTQPPEEPAAEIPDGGIEPGEGELPGTGELPPESETPTDTGGEPTPEAGEIPGAEIPEGGGTTGPEPIITGETIPPPTEPPIILPPPIYIPPWEPGPPRPPPQTPPTEVWWFEEEFNNLLDNDWGQWTTGDAYIELEDGRAHMGGDAWTDTAYIYRWEPRHYPDTFTIYFNFKTLVDTQWDSEIDLIFHMPTKLMIVSWYPPGHIRMRTQSGVKAWDVDDYCGTYHTWKIEATATHITLYKDNGLIFGPEEMEDDENESNWFFLYARYFEDAYIDYLKIKDTS